MNSSSQTSEANRNKVPIKERISLLSFERYVHISGSKRLSTDKADQHFNGLAYQEGKDIVFRIIIEYSSLRGFWPLGNNNRSSFIRGFLKDMIFWLVLKLEISYRVIIIS